MIRHHMLEHLSTIHLTKPFHTLVWAYGSLMHLIATTPTFLCLSYCIFLPHVILKLCYFFLIFVISGLLIISVVCWGSQVFCSWIIDHRHLCKKFYTYIFKMFTIDSYCTHRVSNFRDFTQQIIAEVKAL